MTDFLGRRAALTYTIVEFEPDRAATLRGENATVVSLDRITFGCRIVAAFRREQQALVDEWPPRLSELEERRADVAVHELPILPSACSPARRLLRPHPRPRTGRFDERKATRLATALGGSSDEA